MRLLSEGVQEGQVAGLKPRGLLVRGGMGHLMQAFAFFGWVGSSVVWGAFGVVCGLLARWFVLLGSCWFLGVVLRVLSCWFGSGSGRLDLLVVGGVVLAVFVCRCRGLGVTGCGACGSRLYWARGLDCLESGSTSGNGIYLRGVDETVLSGRFDVLFGWACLGWSGVLVPGCWVVWFRVCGA